MGLKKELQAALDQPVSKDRVYVLRHDNLVQTAYLMARDILPTEGPDGVIDVLEKTDKNHFEQKTVVVKKYCDNTVKMQEQYCFLKNGRLDQTSRRFAWAEFCEYVRNIAQEDTPDAAAEQLREQVENGELVRVYRISDSRGVWTRDGDIGKFVKYLDILRMLMHENFIGSSHRVLGNKITIPFVPVYGLTIYNELDLQDFVDAHVARSQRRSFAQDFFHETGETVDVWDDTIWDEKSMLLIRDPSGQLTPAISNDKEVRDGIESDAMVWSDPLLTNPVKDRPYLEQPTYQNLIKCLAKQNVWDQIKTFRRLYEQTIMAFVISLNAIKNAHPEEWQKYVLLQEIVDRMPKTILNYILYKMNLTDAQAYNLFHPDNIPYKYRRILAHLFGKEKLQDFRKHLLTKELRNSVKNFITKKGGSLSKEQLQLLMEFVGQMKSDFEAIDLEEYCRQHSEELKKEPDIAEESTETAESSGETAESFGETTSGADETDKGNKQRGGKAADEDEAENDIAAQDDFVWKAMVAAADENIKTTINRQAKSGSRGQSKGSKKGNGQNNRKGNGQNGQNGNNQNSQNNQNGNNRKGGNRKGNNQQRNNGQNNGQKKGSQ